MTTPQQHQHAPYPPKTAALGGIPTKGVDVPIDSVFLVLFLGGAIGHMTIYQMNRRCGHKFLLSAMTFGFCMARIVAQILRIVWACYPTDVSVAIAATIFVAAGVIILFIINLIFAERMLRATHPHFGWHPAVSVAFKVLIGLVLVMIVILITAAVQSFYTLNPNTKSIDLDLQRAGSTYFMTAAFLPIPIILLSLILPRRASLEKFGVGHWRTKVAILLTSATLLTLGAGFRTGTTFMNPRPRNDPAWYDAKWCFYFFNFTIETVVVYMYLVFRVDQRFHIPNGSRAAGDYSATNSVRDVESAKDVESARDVDIDVEQNTGVSEKAGDGDKTLHFTRPEAAHVMSSRSSSGLDGETISEKEDEKHSVA